MICNWFVNWNQFALVVDIYWFELMFITYECGYMNHLFTFEFYDVWRSRRLILLTLFRQTNSISIDGIDFSLVNLIWHLYVLHARVYDVSCRIGQLNATHAAIFTLKRIQYMLHILVVWLFANKYSSCCSRDLN